MWTSKSGRAALTIKWISTRPLHISNIFNAPKENAALKDWSKSLSGSGNPYETIVRRRSKTINLSMPNFDHVECLKWTKWNMLRDVKRRHLNAQYWQYRMNLQNISSSRTLPSVVRDIALEERNSSPRDSSCNHLNNRCSLTSRARGKFFRYRLSRIIWRDLADHGLLSGPIRAKWG